MGRPVMAKDTVRFVGEIVAVVVSEGRAAGADAAELVAVDYDPLPVLVSPHDAAKDEVLLFPDVGTNVAAVGGAPEHDEKLFDGCDVVVSGNADQPADGGVPARAALGRRRGGRRRPAHRLALDADAAPGPPRARRDVRPRPGADPRRRPGRRRRLRREDAQRRGDPRRLARAPARAPRPLDGDALGEHGRAQPRPRPGAHVHDRRRPRREGGRVPARDRGRRRRLPGPRRLPAQPDRPDVERRLRHPSDRDLEPRLRHEHDPDRRVPRRGPSGGDAGDRAGDGRARRRAAARSRRAPAQELHPEGRVPAHDRVPRPIRLRRLRGRARPRAALGRLRRPARRAADAAARRAGRSSSGSGSAPTSRSRTGSPRRSSARSRSRRTAARSSAPARSRTARATRRRSR